MTSLRLQENPDLSSSEFMGSQDRRFQNRRPKQESRMEQPSPPSEEAAEHSPRGLATAVDVVLLDAITALQFSGFTVAQQQGGGAAVHRSNGVKEVLCIWHAHRL